MPGAAPCIALSTPFRPAFVVQAYRLLVPHRSPNSFEVHRHPPSRPQIETAEEQPRIASSYQGYGMTCVELPRSLRRHIQTSPVFMCQQEVSLRTASTRAAGRDGHS
ncbi:hypothetical protein BD413DRAFT_39412 [Trametes elegans]|nr:hypothetical protein BD413DRAFT_39412 [Trametes elegans]